MYIHSLFPPPFWSKKRYKIQDYKQFHISFCLLQQTPFPLNLILQMGFSFFNLLLLFLAFFSISALNPPSKSGSDYTSLVYKGCAKQVLTDPTGVFTQALSALFGSLVSQSTKVRFYKTTSGTSQASINGLFQCRGDLSNGDCYKCVSKIPQIVESLCGRTIASRVQLYGCYLLYEISGFDQISGLEMLYKTCGVTDIGGSGFVQRRDTALSVLETGVVSGHGFYTTNYQSVYVLGQCEGDLGDSDCGECVKNAVQRAQVQCGTSISGHIYLHRCFISYTYYPNGIPTRSSSSSSLSSSSSGGNTGKTVAIIVGGTAGMAFVVICLLFARGLMKKHDDD